MERRVEEIMIEAGYAAPELAGRAQKLIDLVVKECASLFPNQFTDERYPRRIDKTILKHFKEEK